MAKLRDTARPPPSPWASLGMAQPSTQEMLDAAAMATMMVPVAGDVAGLASDAYRFATDPESRTLGNAAWASLGMLPFVPFGGATKKVAEALDMSQDARMARAKEQGFWERPFYHATDQDIAEFFPASKKRFWDKQGATWLTDDPKVAETYLGGGWVNANSTDPRVADMIGPASNYPDGVARWFSPGSNIMKVRARLNDANVWDMGGGAYNVDEVAAILKDAKKDKASGVIFERLRDPGLMSLGSPRASNIVAVFKPKDVRSVHAAFDPAKRNSGDLLASLAGAGLLGATAARLYGDDEQ